MGIKTKGEHPSLFHHMLNETEGITCSVPSKLFSKNGEGIHCLLERKGEGSVHIGSRSSL